jgi:glycosyltransferase involved in cell wall biosynthesis
MDTLVGTVTHSPAALGDSSYPTVLHLIGSLARGGTESQLVQLVLRSTAPERHIVAVFSECGALAEKLHRPVHLIGPLSRGFRSLRDDLGAVRDLGQLIRLEKVDLVHAHLSSSELLAAAGVPRGVPIIMSRRGRNLSYEDRPWYRLAESLAHRRVSVMLCNSSELVEFTLKHDLAPPPLKVIPNGVDLDRFAPTPLASGPPTVTVVANLIAYKRHDLFLRAFAMLTKKLPHARATLVGDGPERLKLEKLTFELGLQERVLFVGRLDDPRRFIAEAHVAALTSIHEGLPNAVLESMAMARPVVSTRVGGIPELIHHDREGLLVEDRPDAVADGLLQILCDRERMERMGSAARARAESFGWDQVVARTEDVYRRVIAGERFARGQRVDSCAA